MPYQPNSQRRKSPYVSPFRLNVSDECGHIADGVARVPGPEGETQAGPGDMFYLSCGESHNIEAVTMVKPIWFGDLILGQKCKDDLHP